MTKFVRAARLRCVVLDPLVLALAICGIVSSPVHAQQKTAEFTVIPLVVNVLKGATLSADDIEAAVTEANKILKQANIKLEFDKAKDINPNVSDQGNEDGQVDANEVKKIGDAALGELEKKGKGKGFKIVVTKKINISSPPKLAVSQHDPDKPILYMQDQYQLNDANGNKILSLDAVSRGHIITHEFCHVFTIGPGHKLPAKIADALGHSPDQSNVMFEHTWFTANDRPGLVFAAGSTLNTDQINEIKGPAKKRGDTRSLPIGMLDTKHGSWINPNNPQGDAYVHLPTGTLYAESASSDLQVDIDLEGLYPQNKTVDTTYTVLFDTDNRVTTGGVFGSFHGIDKVVFIDVKGLYPFTFPSGSVAADVLDVASGTVTPLTPGNVTRVATIFDPEFGDSAQAIDDHDAIQQTIPITLLGPLANTVPMGITATDNSSGATNQVAFTFDYNPPPGPRISISPTTAKPGDIVTINASGFSTFGAVTIKFDDNILATAQPAGDGTFIQTFVVPDAGAGQYFVTARDGLTGGFGFDILTVQGPPAPGLAINVTHGGNFSQGQMGVTYNLVVSNSSGSNPTSGTVTVKEAPSSGLSLVSMAGSGWTCVAAPPNCTRNDALPGGSSYPPITATFNVSPSASSPQVNTATVSGGGSASASATDPTTIIQVPFSLAAISGTQQSAPINSVLPPFLVKVQDAGLLPIYGLPVRFTAPVSGASGTFAGATNTGTAFTDTFGVATSSVFTANGVVGCYSVIASVPGLSSSVSLNVCNTAPVVTGPRVILPANVTLKPGDQAHFPVSLSEAPQNDPVTISLSGFDPRVVSVAPTSVLLPLGQTTSNRVMLTGVAFGSTTITGTAYGYAPAHVSISVLFAITTKSLLPGQVGKPYYQFLDAMGGLQPYSWTLAAGELPAGLTMTKDGVISGTPTTPGTSKLTFLVRDANGLSDVETFVLDIAPQGAPSILLPTDLTIAVGQQVVFPVGLSVASQADPVTVSLATSNSGVATLSPPLLVLPAGETLSNRIHISGVSPGTAIVTGTAIISPEVMGFYAPAQVAVHVIAPGNAVGR